tara:strand:- start:13564 stop:13917 length:354 start_codon:yes stop_codon:yes gene_type:complete
MREGHLTIADPSFPGPGDTGTPFPGAHSVSSGGAGNIFSQCWTTPNPVTNVVSHFLGSLPTIPGTSTPQFLLPGPGRENDGEEVVIIMSSKHRINAIHVVRQKSESLTCFTVTSMRH